MIDNEHHESQTDHIEVMRRAVAEVMAVQDWTTGLAASPLRVRGELLMPADEAFAQLRPQFEAIGYTPTLKHIDGLDVVQALPRVFNETQQGIPWTAIFLLIATVISVFFVGVSGELYVPFPSAVQYMRTGVTPPNIPVDRLPTPAGFWEAIKTGLLYVGALLGILGAHEMGHYIVARRNKVHTTLPFFIPLPINILGTLGAVIAMREPAPNRKVQFDIGVAGPLAGLIVAIPIMIIGLSLSEVSTRAEIIQTMPPSMQEEAAFFQEGQSLMYMAAKYVVFEEILPNGERDVFIHPVAFAAWAGFLVTALNLIPIGQLDGGHVLYGLLGKDMEKVRQPVIVLLVLMAITGTIRDVAFSLPPEMVNTDWGQLLVSISGLPIPGWSGWWIWILMIGLMLKSHAPVLDEITELDNKRKALGVVMLVIFVLIFTPTPLQISI